MKLSSEVTMRIFCRLPMLMNWARIRKKLFF